MSKCSRGHRRARDAALCRALRRLPSKLSPEPMLEGSGVPCAEDTGIYQDFGAFQPSSSTDLVTRLTLALARQRRRQYRLSRRNAPIAGSSFGVGALIEAPAARKEPGCIDNAHTTQPLVPPALVLNLRCKSALLWQLTRLPITRPNLRVRRLRRRPHHNHRESPRGDAKTSSGDRHRPALMVDPWTSAGPHASYDAVPVISFQSRRCSPPQSLTTRGSRSKMSVARSASE
jgi:hypothetical protein